MIYHFCKYNSHNRIIEHTAEGINLNLNTNITEYVI